IGGGDTYPNYWWRAIYFAPNGKGRWLPGNGIYDDTFNINVHGQIVGSTDMPLPNDPYIHGTYPAFWENGRTDEIEILPTPLANGDQSWASDINRWGQIVGLAKNSED